MKRTIYCGLLSREDVGREVVLNGWVHRLRDHGGITFINMRDRSGIVQVVVEPDSAPELLRLTAELKNEYCIALQGRVRLRPDEMINPAMPTGEIEVKALALEILSTCEVLPFMIDEETQAKEDLRLRYRYLDLRSLGMQQRLKLRHEVSFAAREYLVSQGFYEIETPTLIRSTPEGARDFLVPSRILPGKFYALPQSPQLYKQLLMVSGFDRYFQIARCYRDEDARGDRQPEFTQIDLEMSFVSRKDVFQVIEGMFKYIFKKVLKQELVTPFPHLPYQEALNRFGTDKPDLRFGLELQDFDPYVAKSDFQVFKNILACQGVAKALVVPASSEFSRKRLSELEDLAKTYGAKGLAWMKVTSTNTLEGGVAKFFEKEQASIIKGLEAHPSDLILLVADKLKVACQALGAVRSRLGLDLNLIPNDMFNFCWIVDFPLFEYNEEEKRWEAAHHLFSMPQEEYLPSLENDPGSVKGELYDLVCNGVELASGSIRIHDPELQKRVFAIVGISEEEANKRFGFLLEAFRYGPPPHGGIAPGLDRLVSLLAGTSTIREVIAFPKNTLGASPMDESPSEVTDSQLAELHLALIKEDKANPNPKQ